ncbi:MAG: UDP-D-galactose:(glucosyl)lipopolysaccharide-1,6-D-galactosyltransferase [Methanobacterium sp. PtaU1.Bin242]|nr:MAG: UDP-D-galactose:(glucosyl)lipopolysaccharide-1,6-D-galactosyltransferase [Methanobacterium sp. PtaU1.Bin242]
MKILILVDSLKIGGGSDKFAAILGSELHDEGYDVSFLTLSDEDPKYEFKGDYYTLNEKDIYGNNIKRFFKLLKYSPRVKKLCEELEIDAIISAGDPANFHALLSRYFFGNETRIIISQHMSPDIFLESSIKSNLIKFFYPRADKTVCVSKEIEKILNEKYDVGNTLTIYNMMDIEENIKLSPEELPSEYKEIVVGHGEDHLNFINIGRLDRQKGQWFLIRSFKKVVDNFENARLFIIGEGDLKHDLEYLINELNLENNVFLLGNVENVFPFLGNCDCFVFTSLWEGFGLVLVEALSVNLPTISTDCKTGPREILCPELDLDTEIEYPYYGNSGILIQTPPNKFLLNNIDEVPLIKEEDVLADLMTKIIEDEEVQNKYSNGLLQAENFDVKKIMAQWNELLQNK